MTSSLLLAGLMAGCGGGGSPVGQVDENGAPRIGAIPATAEHHVDFDHELVVTDPDGDPVDVDILVTPAWMAYDAESMRFTGIPGEDRIGGTFRILVDATDGTATTRADLALTVVVGRSGLVFEVPWLAATPHKFGHDGEPVETERFRVYGGFASRAARQEVAEFVEGRIDVLGARLGVESPDRYEFPPDGRLHVFADKLQGDGALGQPSTVNGWAFRDGMIVMSPDAPRRTRQGYDQVRIEGLWTHELMHDVEFLLIGRAAGIGSTDAWFREGIATYMAGLAPGGAPLSSATVSTMQQWRQAHASVAGGGNPIAIHTFQDFPPGVQTDTYYFWFGQAIRYLVEAEGFGLGEDGLRLFYDDIRGGTGFRASFANRTGVTLETFEAEFWDRLTSFLSGG